MSDFPLYDKTTDYKMLKRAYKSTQICSRKYRKDAIVFDMARERNLIELWRELRNETYFPRDYTCFTIYNPKERLIHAPRLRDKIVQYAAHRVLWDFYGPVFINESFACMEERGSHKAVATIQHFMRLCQWQNGDGWILKLDVQRYFYSIDREVLKQILRKKIKDTRFLRLLDITIDSSPEGECGIPLGCATSQDFANIYLNELDQFAKRFLAIKFYVRYMDDIVCIFPSKVEAQAAQDKMIDFLEERLHLEANPKKTKIFPLSQGVNACGFKIYTTHTLVRESSKRAMKRRINAMDKKRKAGEISSKEVKHSVASWLGHARHSNSYNLCKKIFKRYKYINIESPDNVFGQNKKK